MSERTCTLEGCDSKRYCRGFCIKHYGRWRDHGTTDEPVRTLIPAERRFWPNVKQDEESGCWEWSGAHSSDGYGQIRVDGAMIRTHRFAYELLVGPIPDGLHVDHLCRNRGCCNPGHLEPVTMAENILRGEGPPAQNSRKTHCPQGHAYDAVNTRRYRGYRYCKACAAQRDRERRRRAA